MPAEQPQQQAHSAARQACLRCCVLEDEPAANGDGHWAGAVVNRCQVVAAAADGGFRRGWPGLGLDVWHRCGGG